MSSSSAGVDVGLSRRLYVGKMLEREQTACDVYSKERERRNRLVGAGDPRVRNEPFVGAPVRP
jgi:hypothetical protein